MCALKKKKKSPSPVLHGKAALRWPGEKPAHCLVQECTFTLQQAAGLKRGLSRLTPQETHR